MRNFRFLLIFCCVLITHLTFGQTSEIKGVITDETGAPLQSASVTLKGTTTGTTTSTDGSFRINAPSTGTLVISGVGLTQTEINIQGRTFIEVRLNRASRALDEVVVTALGIRRNKNTLPYAAQTVGGEAVSQSRTNNLVSALSGKVSGVEIRTGSAMGASSNVVIRGTKSLTNNNQALFVIDGVPFDNSNNSNSNKTSVNVNDAARGRGGYDYGNAAADINPDDVESITVLKGAAASALYGSRASNGVVLITTKKGRRGLGISVNSGVTVGQIDKTTYPKYQKEYGAGYATSGYGAPAPNGGFFYFDANGDGQPDLVVPTTEDASYGQKFDPNLMVYHWDAFDRTSPNYQKSRPWIAAQNGPESFFETAVSTNNSVFVDGSDEKGSFKLGYTRNDEKGILPNSSLLKNLVNFNSSYKITSQLTAAATINFSNVNGKGRYGTGYDDFNVNQSFRQWNQSNVDFGEQKDAYFRSKQNMTWNWADASKESGLKPIYTDNPYWMRYENYQQDSRFRYFGTASLNYAPTTWLNLLGRVSLDSYDELQEERIAIGSHDPSSYSRFNRTFRELNYDLLANMNFDLTSDFNLKGLLGTNIRRTMTNSVYAATNGGLVVPKLYSLTNSLNPIVAPTEADEQVAVDGYFGGLTLSYQELLTLDLTGRVDRASTLPAEDNTYFYPSVSGSFQFSKLLPTVNWLSSGKLRANYAQVSNSALFGQLADIYDKPTPFGTATLFSLPLRKNNPDLKVESTQSFEAGIEAAFFANRLGFDLTWYTANTVDQIIPVSVSTATGYTSKVVNAGTVRNRGIELSLFATPLKTENFSWNTTINFTRNRNKVIELYEESTNLEIANMQGGISINATKGQPYGTIQGKTWERHANGEKLVGANGYYVQTATTTNVIGNVNPDWIGGMYNTFKYKNLSLGFLVDVRRGGDVFSLDMYYGLATGIYPETVQNNDLGNPSRNPVSAGGGIIVQGVTADGKPNTKRVENDYGIYGYARNPAAAFVYDASYVKLRELNLTYSLPTKAFGKLPFKGVDLSLIGRNLWIIHKNLPYADPEENLTSGNVQGYQSGAYPTTRSIGLNLRVRF
ncbi:SusC/RagA family TonB-linked outer membrane protein [Segetibacter sp. 3557_3]|uniref:SusC/RagA family TonB-linked outer membrane protein n=1 Tax=Segetibacter sp. 3557_3 TaxID=2547429 RepID=UPI001058BBC2|nr:SusC/RagA family TonB-linked outer membrane protein [Segetibacter sp. 3557_3]TDH26862.1 SusC/RagA family TonB-linked outer membrane protein [Segetibacter sp. 3557_3]